VVHQVIEAGSSKKNNPPPNSLSFNYTTKES